MDRPEYVKEMLAAINGAKKQRMEILLDLGLDAVLRRGWYESTDFWNPEMYREFAMPAIQEEIQLAHQADTGYIYLMMTGLMPLLPELAELPFDCLHGAEPALDGQDLGEIHRRLPGKSIFGGISGPEHFGAKKPDVVARAVEESFRLMGKTGLILGMGDAFRPYWSWENFAVFEETWKRLR